MFTRSGTTWTPQGPALVASDANVLSGLGSSVALSADGNTALLGGPGDNDWVGAAWVFTRSGTTWTQQGPKRVGTGAIGQSNQGSSVALSGDGATALVGATGDNGGRGAAWVNPPAVSWASSSPAPGSPVLSSPLPAAAISGLRVFPRKISIAGRKVRRGCVKPTKQNRHNKPCRRPIKLRVTYTLNRAATVTFTLTRQLPGRKVRGKCVNPTRANRHKRRCTRLVPVRGSIVTAAHAGANGFTFNGTIGRQKLASGTYRLTATPAGGQPQTVTLQIVT